MAAHGQNKRRDSDLKRLAKGVAQYQNLWGYPWDWLCKAVGPQDLFTDEELCVHLFDDQFSDRPEYQTSRHSFRVRSRHGMS
jgi:hypothetical protein